MHIKNRRRYRAALRCVLMVFFTMVGFTHIVGAAQVGEYRLGPGDLIKIQVFGESDLTVQTRLPGSGKLSYPFLGEINVAGQTVRQLRNTIANGLAGKYVKNPDVQVYILEYRPVYITGEVKKPGGYPYVPGLTVIKAVSLAGGFTALASTRHMYLTRDGQTGEKRQEVELNSPVGPGDILSIDEGFF